MEKKYLLTAKELAHVTPVLNWFTEHDAHLELTYEAGQWTLYLLEGGENND